MRLILQLLTAFVLVLLGIEQLHSHVLLQTKTILIQNKQENLFTEQVIGNEADNKNNGLTSSFSSFIDQVAKNVEDVIGNVIRTLRTYVYQLSRGLEQLEDVLQTLDSDLLKTGNDTQLIKSEIEWLFAKVDNQYHTAVRYLNETLMNKTEVVDNWTTSFKEELRSINNTIPFKEICYEVNDFIKLSSDLLRSCCHITIRPMRSLCRRTHTAFTEAFSYLADVLDKVQKCIEDKNSYLQFIIPYSCINVAYDDIRLARLIRKIHRMFPIKILRSKCGFSILLMEVEQRKTKVL